MKMILFVSQDNAIRSQMAEGLLKHLKGHLFESLSAGVESAARIHPMAVAVMAEIGIDISHQKPKVLTSISLDVVDRTISFLPGEMIPLDAPEMEFWDIASPEINDLHPEEDIRRFRKIRDRIRARVQALGSQPW